jgi:hypothetical protein
MIPAAVWPSLGVVLAGGGVVGLLVFTVRRGHARGRLARLARHRHLNFMPADLHILGRRLGGLKLLEQGHSRYLSDIVAGSTRQGWVSCFRYRYERGFGVARRSYRWTVAALECEHAAGDLCLWHPELPDPRLGEALRESPRRVPGLDGPRFAARPSPPERLRVWFEGLDFSAVLQCHDHVVSLAGVDDGTPAQYESLLEALAQAAERLPRTAD